MCKSALCPSNGAKWVTQTGRERSGQAKQIEKHAEKMVTAAATLAKGPVTAAD